MQQSLFANQDNLINTQMGDMKMITSSGGNQTIKNQGGFEDFSTDYVSKLLEENSKTNEAFLESTRKKLDGVILLFINFKPNLIFNKN